MLSSFIVERSAKQGLNAEHGEISAGDKLYIHRLLFVALVNVAMHTLVRLKMAATSEKT